MGRAAADEGWSVGVCLPRLHEATGLLDDLHCSGVAVAGWIPSEEEGRGYSRFAWLLARTYFRVSRIAQSFRPDLVLFSVQAPGAATGAIAAVARAAIPSLLVFQLFPRELEGRERRTAIWKRVVRWGRLRGQHWVAVSEQNRRCISESFELRIEDVALIRNGARSQERSKSGSEIRRLFEIPSRARVITTVGRLEASKGYLDLLAAVPTVVRSSPDAHFLWVGEGSLRAMLEERIRNASLGSSVTLTGFRADVSDILGATDVFVLPTHGEGLSFALIEAALAGLPLVATRVAGIAELVEDGRSGLLVAPGQPDELAVAIVRVLESDVLRERLAARALESLSHLTEQRMLDETLRALRSIVLDRCPTVARKGWKVH